MEGITSTIYLAQMGIGQDLHQNRVQVHLHFYPVHQKEKRKISMIEDKQKSWTTLDDVSKGMSTVGKLPPQNIDLLRMPPLFQQQK